MKKILTISYLLLTFSLFGQKSDCHFTLSGIVLDSFTLEPISLTNISLMDSKSINTSSDKQGKFTLDNLCLGNLELHISHLECEHIHIHFLLSGDTGIVIYLKHSEHEMQGATIVAKSNQTETIAKLTTQQLNLQKGSSIAELMQNIGGITLLKTGGTISKPMVNGLHSNRVIILNHGIRQEGQNWGLEHAPEIDAFLATDIELLKGAEAFRYAADGIGGVIMVKPASIFNYKAHQINGEFNLVGNSNGRGGATSLIIGSKISEKAPIYWRLQGTLKRTGNLKAPDYFLSNTGFKEINYSAALGYKIRKFNLELFYSNFYNKIAIFKGSQVGNIDDLQKAFESDSPLVNSDFTYEIDRPYQEVQHQLAKFNTEWQMNALSKLILTASVQKNNRKEYDIVRSSNSYQGPDLNYFMNTFLADIMYQKNNLHFINYSAGINGTYQTNSYTGRFFIPGYYNKGIAAYGLAEKTIGSVKLEAALRYDIKNLTTYLWNGNTIKIQDLKFNNVAYLLQAIIQKNRHLKITFGTSSTWRPPAVNELYSNGLHQGMATIEIGDPTLKLERSFNQNLIIRHVGKSFFLESELFFKRINGFINLVPSLPPQLTIRGAFPVYKYVQQDVNLYGINFLMRKEIKKYYYIKVNSNLMFGDNIEVHQPLSQMPPLSGKIWIGKEKNQYMFQLWYQATAEQFRYVEASDYVAPPKGFALFGCDASYDFKLRNQSFKFNLSINNLLNTSYREYLNRWRYFADEPGFGLTARLIVPLQFNTVSNKN